MNYFKLSEKTLVKMIDQNLSASAIKLYLLISVRNGEHNIPTPIDYETVAQILNISRPTYYKARQELMRKGMIRFHYQGSAKNVLPQ